MCTANHYVNSNAPFLCIYSLLNEEYCVSLLNLLEMQTVIKQAICVSVLQMCCNYGNKQR